MTGFTIIGTGTMAKAIGGVLSRGGSVVRYVAHAQVGTAPLDGDVVVLAVPYPALASIVDAYADQLRGKTVVDITNPVDFATMDALVVAPDSSAAAELQAALPESHVLKAFNTTFGATLAAGQVGAQQTTVLIAGDDEASKETLAAAIRAGGLEALDAGSLARARELEALGFLQISLAARGAIAWTGGFAVIR